MATLVVVFLFSLEYPELIADVGRQHMARFANQQRAIFLLEMQSANKAMVSSFNLMRIHFLMCPSYFILCSFFAFILHCFIFSLIDAVLQFQCIDL